MVYQNSYLYYRHTKKIFTVEYFKWIYYSIDYHVTHFPFARKIFKALLWLHELERKIQPLMKWFSTWSINDTITLLWLNCLKSSCLLMVQKLTAITSHICVCTRKFEIPKLAKWICSSHLVLMKSQASWGDR